MRRILLLCCLLAAGCGSDDPEIPWEAVELGTDAEFRDIFFLDARNGWMVGEVSLAVPGGIVARTTDGGLTWQFKTGVIPTRSRTHSVDMNAVWFTDLEHGTIAAEAGTILRTEDGGATWKKVRPTGPVYAQNQDIHFINLADGWIIGRQGVRYTQDAGVSWTRIDEVQKLTGRAIHFVDNNRGWVVGKFGEVHHTDDGGYTWTKVPAAGDMEGRSGDDKTNLQAVFFVDEQHGWIAGYRREMPELEQFDYGVVFHTHDGGATWAKQLDRLDILLRDIRFIDPGRGWAVGYNVKDGTSTVLGTTDGGRTWQEELTVFGEELMTIFARDGYVWTVGDRVRNEPQRLFRLVLPAAAGGLEGIDVGQ